MRDVFVVVMAGGSGTRFWPAGRRRIPKQLLAVTKDRTLIQATIDRIPAAIPRERVLVVTNVAHAAAIAEQVELPAENIVTEPAGRDTLPCIALAALLITHRDPGGFMIVMAADHVIEPRAELEACLSRALSVSESTDALVTIGVEPTSAATGYGYIQMGEAIGDGAHAVRRFVEKPDRATAQSYVESGDYLWNSGIFVWKAATILREIRDKKPQIAGDVESLRPLIGTPAFAAALGRVYAGLEKISIDKGVVEKAARVAVVRATFRWDDVGSFEALARHNEKDAAGNVARGRAHLFDTRSTIVDNRSDGIVATLGVDDLIIVRTGDAVLVARRDRAEDVKKLVDALAAAGHEDVL
jgi:mannose-1-phosphate guanylyltransferase